MSSPTLEVCSSNLNISAIRAFAFKNYFNSRMDNDGMILSPFASPQCGGRGRRGRAGPLHFYPTRTLQIGTLRGNICLLSVSISPGFRGGRRASSLRTFKRKYLVKHCMLLSQPSLDKIETQHHLIQIRLAFSIGLEYTRHFSLSFRHKVRARDVMCIPMEKRDAI